MEPSPKIETKSNDRKFNSFHSFPEFNEREYTVDYKQFMNKETVKLKIQKSQDQEVINDNKQKTAYNLTFSNVNIPISKIDSIEDRTNSTIVNIFYNKTSYNLNFKSLMDKYHFKSLLYNTLLKPLEKAFFTKDHLQLRVGVITWNIANIPCLEDITPLFDRTPLDSIEILAIGIQECAMMQAGKWHASIKDKLLSNDFIEVAHESLLQMFLVVYIKKEYKSLVSRVEKATKAMGFANVVGNKGGIVISMFVMGFQFIFINCHLAPKMFKMMERIKMAKQLIDSIKVGDLITGLDVQSDYLFWCGDLNYRVDCTYTDTIEVLKKMELAVLLNKDQLLKAMKNNDTFCQFMEGEISFLPTYRRTKNTNPFNEADNNLYNAIESENKNQLGKIESKMYNDIFSDKDNQSPSWCDRILVKSTRQIDFKSYDSVYRLRQSDHLPVAGRYMIFLSLPLLTNVEEPATDDIDGELRFRNIKVSYKAEILTKDLGVKETESKDQGDNGSYSLVLSVHYFINEKPTEQNIDFSEKIQSDTIEKKFKDMTILIPPKLIFDYPQMKANNIFFVLTLKNGKGEDKEIGTYYHI